MASFIGWTNYRNIIDSHLLCIFSKFFKNIKRCNFSRIIVNIVLLSSYRFLLHFVKGTLYTFIKDEKKYIVIGNEKEATTIAEQLSATHLKHSYIGFISLNNGINLPAGRQGNSKNLGAIENLHDILEAYKPNEILFSTEELSTQFIIETMSKIDEPIAFRLVTKNNTIISSTSKNKSGEIYSFDINLSPQQSWIDKLRSWI